MLEEQWDDIISPRHSLLDLKIKEVWKYRDLLLMLVKRDFVTYYKQTILGPLWFFIQPLFTTLMYTIVFGNIAKISTNGQPQVLFYMAGITAWNYFADCLNKTSTVFKDNQQVFGKVYFPRLVVPLSIVTSNLIKFGIQLILFLIILIYFVFGGFKLNIDSQMIVLPLLIILMAFQGLGIGMLISSLTTKYRDLIFLLQFGIQLLMYATPVIYPISTIPEKYQFWIKLNPMTAVIESFRTVFLGGKLDWNGIIYSSLVTFILVLSGTLIFNRTEKNFMDTV